MSTEPLRFRAGSTVTWTRQLDAYPAPTWTLEYYFQQLDGSGYENITAAGNGAEHTITVDRATSQNMAAGEWRWVARVNDGTEYVDIAQSVVEIQPDAEGAHVDLRTRDERYLAAVRDVLEGRLHKADLDQYSVGDRSHSFMGREALLELEEKLVRRVNDYRAGEKRRAGQPRRRNLKIAYGRY